MKKNIIFLIFLFQSLLNQIRNQKNFEFLSQFCLSDQFFSQNNGKCESCPLECDGCIETNCLSCKYGQNIDGKCLIENQQCNKGYSLDQIEKICKPCDVPFCLECPQTKKCQKCKDGFLLDTFQSQCIADQDQQLWEKYYKYTCPSLFIENKGDCVQKSICSSFKFQSQNQFSSKINKVIEFPFKNYVIGISNTQAILFDTLNINAIKELLNLYQSQTERYLELISYKQYALIISNINIYAINLDYQGLESRFQYSTITSNSDLDYRKIYINEEKLQIFSLTNNQKNIRQTVINFVQGTTLQFQISQNLNNNGLLIQNENQIIFYFQIFQQHEILVFVSESQITFLDLQKIKLSNLKLESGYNLLSNIVVMMSQKSSENSSLLTFFVFAQVEMIQYKLNAFKIQLDKQNFQSISFSEPQFNFDFFSQNQPEISFHHFNWFAYEIESQIYFLLIADKAKNSQVYKMKFFGVAEAEYFFSGNINYIFEFTGQIDWHSNQKPFLTKTEQNKNLLLIVPFQNQLQFFEIQQNILLSAYQNISFDQDNLSINIQQSQESRSKILLILDQILGQIQLETDGKSIEIMLSSKTLFNSKINQYLGYIQNSKLFLPLDINQQQSQYIFIVFDMNDRYRVQVVELQIEINGNQVFKAQSFISYQQINEEVQQCDLYNDKEVILITTNLGIYQVAYHTLKLIKFLPILNKLAQNQNVIFQSIYSANQLNLQMLIVEGDLLNNQDILVVFGVYQDNWIQNKIDINKLQRKFIYYMEHNQNQLCSLLMIYFQGAFIDASKELLTDISIQQIQFIDQETIGIFLQKNLQDPNSFCFSKIKVQLIDSQNLKLLIEYSEEIPQEFKCNINEQIQIVTCSKAEFYDVSTQVLKIYVFDWQNMDFVKDQDGNAINIGVFNFEINERFDLDFQKVILLNDEYHIYSTFRQTVPGSETFTQIKVLNNYFTYNFQSQQLNEISQFINIVQASSKFYYSNQLIDYTDKASGIQRIFQPISNFQRFINLNYGQIKDDNSYIFSEQSSQLIFRKKNELIAANRFSQFDGQKKIFDSYYKFSIEQLGIIAVQKDEELQFISVDNFEVLQKINTEIGTKFFYSKKYKKLILQQTSIIKVYDLKDFFTQALYTHDLNSNLNTSYNLVCFILEETSYLVCNKFGLYDFENRIFYQNKNLIVSDFRQSPFISENKFYALFNKMTNLFVFSHSKKQFLKNQILSNYTTPSFKIILHPEISDQMIAIGDINFCQIYQLPDFYLLFEQTQKQSNQNMAIQFFYNPEAPSLIIKTIEKLIIHKLPYIISNIPQQIDYKSPYQIYWYTFTENYFYVLSSQRLYDLSRAIYFESINLATGSYKLTNMILTENLNSNTYQYWEEKQIIYSDNILISLGDIQLGWSSEQKLLEYFDRFNFILQIYQGGQIYELKTIDVSEMFPFSKQNSQFIDTVDTTNFNYYFLNNGIEHIIYFNFQSFQIQRSSFGNENSLTLLDIYDALKKKNLKEKFQSSYRSSYKIFPLNSQNSDLKLYGFSWKCKLFVFSQDTIIDIIELSSYKCQIYQFNHEVYLIQGKFLLQVIFINQNIELKPKLNYYNTIQDVYSDQFNKWIFITSEQQNFCVLGLNTSQQMKIQNIEIESQKISLVHFFTSSSLDILTLGLIDSQLQIYQLLNYQPDQVDKNLHCGQLKMVDTQVNSLNQLQLVVSIYITCTIRIFFFQGTYDQASQSFINPIEQISYNLIHSRSFHKIKVLLNSFVAVFSQRQVTVYSSSLQYIARVEDSLISQITDLILAPNQFNLIVVETNNILIYSLKIMNKKQRLILQINFPYQMPIIYSVKQLVSQNNILEFKGIDAKNIFQFQYLPYFGQSISQQTDNCVQQIESLNSKENQQQQYISLLLSSSDSSNSIINAYLSVQKNQEDLLLNIVSYAQDFQQQKDILGNKINIDINLNKLTLQLFQKEDSLNQSNLFNSIKITNGVIKINQTISIQNFEQFILQEVHIIFQEKGQVIMSSGNDVGVNNCTLVFENDNEADIKDIFTFQNIQSTIINQINIKKQTVLSQSLLSFTNCNSSLIQQVQIYGSQFTHQFPLIKFNQQTQNITLQNFQLIESKLEQLLFFTDTQNILLSDFLFEKINQEREQRLLQEEQTSLQNELPFIYSEFAQKEIQIKQFNLSDSKFSSFIKIQNWMEEIQTINNKQFKTQNISNFSSSKLTQINIERSQFINYSIHVDDNLILLDNLKFTQVQDGLIQILNAQLIVNQLNVLRYTLFLINNLFITQNCIAQFNNIQVSKTDILEKQGVPSENMKLIGEGFFYFKNTSADIRQLDANHNDIQVYFLHFFGINPQFQVSTENKYDVQLQQCTILNTNTGGGIMIQEIKNTQIFNSKINFNKGREFGGGISIFKCLNVILLQVDIFGNKAFLYGGGIYLKESNLQIITCKIQDNYAIIGGGIRYLNSILDLKQNQDDTVSIDNNLAIIYGNNISSNPKKIQIKYDSNEEIISATSSSNQQLTKIVFQLVDEEDKIIRLPNRLNSQQEDFNSLEIFNYLISFQHLSQVKRKNLILILQEDLDELYQFNLFSDFDTTGQVQIQQKNSLSQYNQTAQYTHSLNKYILESGYSNQLGKSNLNQIYQFQIKSLNNLFNTQIQIKFRNCIQGEIVNKVGLDFYECFQCSNNTYSLVDPYANSLQNQCKECPYGAQSCIGSQIIPKQGYWIEDNYPNLYFCFNNYEICQYNTNTNTPCLEGYAGPLCESCAYHQVNSLGEIQNFSKKGKYKCTFCSNQVSQTEDLMLSIFLGFLFLLYLVYQIASNFKKKVIKMKLLILKRLQTLFISNSLNSNEKSFFSLKIMISYMQIISIVFQLKIQTPNFTMPFSFFGNNLQTTVYSLDCVFLKDNLIGDTPIVYVRLIWTLIQPFLYIIFLVIFYLIASMCIKVGTKNRVQNLFLSGLLKIYYMFYPGIIQIVIGTISCKEFNGKQYVLNDLQFGCYDNQYYIFNYVFGLPFLILTLIIPSLILRKLIKSKEHITQDPNIFISYGFYFSEYKYKYCYWEIIKIYQKIIVFILIGIFNDNTSLQVILVSMIIILYMRFQLHIQPFTYLQFNKLDHLSQITAAMTILCLGVYSNYDNLGIEIASLVFVSIANLYFFIRFLKNFSYHLIRQQNFKFLLDILVKLQNLYPNCIPVIETGRVNILRQTKNWKKFQLAFSRRSYKGVYSYTNQIQFKSQIGSFSNQDKFKNIQSKRTQQTLSQDQKYNNIQELERVPNTERGLLTSDDDDNNNNVENFLNQIQTNKDGDSQIIGQEIINYNLVRTTHKLAQPGLQLKFLSQDSQIPDEQQNIFSKYALESKNNKLNKC